MKITKKVTVKYPAGHSYEFNMEKDKEMYCPRCGEQEIWFEQGECDFYQGVQYYCTACKFTFTMPSYGDADEQIISQLRE